MEMTEEEFESFKREYEERQQKGVETSRIHDEIYQLYEQNLLNNIQPIWHSDITHMDFSVQNHKIDSDIIVGGLDVIRDVDIEMLLNHVVSFQQPMFRERKLYNKDLLDISISRIIDHWRKREALIPPTMVIIDAEYPNPTGWPFSITNELQPIDGKHRLNAAYCLGAQQIPIIVLSRQANHIREMLGVV